MTFSPLPWWQTIESFHHFAIAIAIASLRLDTNLGERNTFFVLFSYKHTTHSIVFAKWFPASCWFNRQQYRISFKFSWIYFNLGVGFAFLPHPWRKRNIFQGLAALGRVSQSQGVPDPGMMTCGFQFLAVHVKEFHYSLNDCAFLLQMKHSSGTVSRLERIKLHSEIDLLASIFLHLCHSIDAIYTSFQEVSLYPVDVMTVGNV